MSRCKTPSPATGRVDALDRKAGRGQERYYLDKIAEGVEDYYSGEGEAPGEWIGDAARDLGLAGEVGEDQLVAMLTWPDPLKSVRPV